MYLKLVVSRPGCEAQLIGGGYRSQPEEDYRHVSQTESSGQVSLFYEGRPGL